MQCAALASQYFDLLRRSPLRAPPPLDDRDHLDRLVPVRFKEHSLLADLLGLDHLRQFLCFLFELALVGMP